MARKTIFEECDILVVGGGMAGKPLPMLSIQDAVNENLIEPIFIGHEVEIQKCAED